MPVAQAADLAAMTDAVFEPYDRDADRAALQSLAVELQTHVSPQTAVETLERFKWAGRFRHDPESIVMEIQGVTHLFVDKDNPPEDSQTAHESRRAGESELLSAAAAILSRHQLRARFGLADTVGAAWALANHAPRTRERAGAWIPDRHDVFIAPPGQTAEALHTLPVAALRLQPDVVATLSRLGVETIGSLLRLPREGLATRLGMPLCNRIAQATGEVEESLIAIAPQCEHSATLLLEYPSDAIDLLADRLSHLIVQSTATLHRLHRGVLRLRCQLEFTQHPPMVLETGLFAPTLDAEHLTSLMLGALESQRLGSKVTRMTVAVAQHAALSSRQPSIFGPDFAATSGEDWTLSTETARLIDGLAGRLGEDNVRGVRVSEDPLPENAIVDFPMTADRMKTQTKNAKRKQRSQVTARQRAAAEAERFDAPPSGIPSGISTSGNGGPRVSDLGRRPIELFAPPPSITALRLDSDSWNSGDGFPARFRIRGRVEPVRHHWGPERIETRWWRGPLIRRDYFRIELESGARLWIFRDLREEGDCGRWYLHGRFA